MTRDDLARCEALTDDSGNVSGLWIPAGAVEIDRGNLARVLRLFAEDQNVTEQIEAVSRGQFRVRAEERFGRPGSVVNFLLSEPAMDSAQVVGARPSAESEAEGKNTAATWRPKPYLRSLARAVRWTLYAPLALAAFALTIGIAVAALGGALYIGGWVMLIGGIADAINLFKSDALATAGNVAMVLLKMFGAVPLAGAFVWAGIGLVIPMWTLVDRLRPS